MSPFDPAPEIVEPARAPATRPQRTDSAALFDCPICGELRIDAYAILCDGAEVTVSGELYACGLCGGGCRIHQGGEAG